MNYLLGLDIGGTHMAGALVGEENDSFQADSYQSMSVDANGGAEELIQSWTKGIKKITANLPWHHLAGMGIAMPGPFDYEKGISLIQGLEKYDALYRVDVKSALRVALELPENFPICFRNDAICFALGEDWKGAAAGYQRVVAITLGTGLGAAFLQNGRPVLHRGDVPEDGTLYPIPYKKGKAEDYFSARGLLRAYAAEKGEQLQGVKTIYERACRNEPQARAVWAAFGRSFATFLAPWLRRFQAECLILGGGISQAGHFFTGEMNQVFEHHQVTAEIKPSELGNYAAIWGAVRSIKKNG